jgi:hypothetical protein
VNGRLLSNRRSGLAILGAAMIFLLELLYACRVCLVYRPHIEGGLIPLGADLIVHGMAIYKDHFTVMWPGSYLLLALPYALFGSTWLVTRLTLAITVFAAGLLSFLMLRRHCGLVSSIMPSAILCFVALPCWSINYHHWDAMLFTTCYVFAFDRLVASQHKSTLWLCLAGIAGGLTLSCYQPLLLCIGGANVLEAILCWLATRDRQLVLRNFVVLSLWMLLFLAANLLYAAVTGGWQQFIAQTVLFPLHDYSRINNVSYAANNLFKDFKAPDDAAAKVVAAAILGLAVLPWVVVLLAPFVAIVSGGLIFARCAIDFSRRRVASAWDIVVQHQFATMMLAVGFASWLVALHRPEIQRLFWGSFQLVLFSFYLLDNVARGQQWKRTLARVLYVGTACGTAVYALSMLMLVFSPPFLVHSRRGDFASRDQLDIVAAVQAVTKPYEKVLVYPYDTTINYITNTRFPDIHPWLQYNYNSAADMRSSIDDMEASKVRYVIWDTKYNNDTFAQLGWPGYVPVPKQKLIMEPYIEQHFRLVKQYGQYRLMERR